MPNDQAVHITINVSMRSLELESLYFSLKTIR